MRFDDRKLKVVVAFWDRKSRGTKNMIETMQRIGKSAIINYID